MSNRKQAVLDHNIAFFVSFYLFMTKRFSEAIKIFKESLLLVNHKALRNEIEFVSIVKLLAYSLMCHGYMLLEDMWNFSKVWLHLIIVVPGCTLKTILKPRGLEEFYKRQCKYEEAHALWMEAGEKEEEDQDEMFPSFLDEISPGEYKMTAAIVHEMSTSRKECFSGKIFCRQLSSSFVKIRKFFKEALSIVEVFDKEKPVPPHYERFSEIIHFYDESIKHLKQETLSLEKKNGSGAKAASVHELRVLGKTWVFSGDYFKAKENFEEALAISIEQGDKKEEAACYGMLGAVFQGLQRYDEAKKNLDKQLAIYKEIGDIHGQARSYENLGTLYTFLVDTVKAEEYFRKALEIAKKTGHRDIETSCCKKLGDLFAALGKPVRAKKFSDKALVLSKEMENYHALALGMKPFNKAAARLLNSMHGLDVDTRGCQDEMRALFSDQAFLGHKILSFMFCCLGNPHTGLCSAELARARALADFLSAQYSVEMKRSVDYFNPQKRIGMERILKTERNCCCLYISYFSQFITVWLLKADHPLLFRRIEVSDFCAKLLRNDIDASCRKIYRKEHHLTPEQDKDQSLFPSQSFQEDNLPFSRLIEEDDDEEDQRTSLTPADYYNITIAPVVDFLDEPEIVIVPDRVFFRLPFAALKDKSGPYLSETFRIRIVPSLTILKMIQDSPADYHSQTGALIVGDPDVGRVLYKGNFRRIGRLSEASKEAEMIGRLLDVQPLLGKQATKEKILQSINSVSLVHFAAHGDDERGEIFLAPPPMRNRTPQEEDYLLTMAEISRVRVRAKLVVLSCCHSANGKIRQEGVVGIGRAFLASGARSVLVALWAIEDKATYQLMIRFYEHLVRGESASESLHQAMKWMRENGYSKVGQWAPFMLIGDNVSFDFQRIR